MTRIFVVALLSMLAPLSLAMDVEVKMLAKGSALLQINGKQRMLRDGDRSPEGVLLVTADSKKATIEIDGKRQTMTLTRRIATNFVAADRSAVRIASSRGGHYVTPGLINGLPVEFMVDTGASIIAMNYHQAEALGIDYRAGQPIRVNTANGVSEAFQIVLNRVSVGDIELNQVAAAVTTTEYPQAILLGNSYLGKVDLRVDAGVLLLQERK